MIKTTFAIFSFLILTLTTGCSNKNFQKMDNIEKEKERTKVSTAKNIVSKSSIEKNEDFSYNAEIDSLVKDIVQQQENKNKTK